MPRRDSNNTTRYWWDRHIAGLSLMCADLTTHEYAPHTHDAVVIAITEAGGAVVNCQSSLETVACSTLFVSNPEEKHSARMGRSGGWQYRSIYLAPTAIEVVADGLGLPTLPCLAHNMIRDDGLIGGFGRLHRSLEAGSDGLRTHELLISAMDELLRRYGGSGTKDDISDRTIAAKVIAVMREQYAETLSLGTLAAVAGLTSFQLIGLFKRTVGLTPHTYLTHVRLSMACRLLRRGGRLAETAAAVGFCDQSALTRAFKRSYAITPLQFAEAARSCKATWAIFANTNAR